MRHVVEHFVERFGRPLLPVGVVVRRGGQRGVEPVEHGLYGFGVFEEFRDGAGLSFHRAPDEGSHVFVGVELFGVFVHRFGDGPARRHVYDEVFPGGAAGFEPLPAGESGVERPALLIGGGFDGVRVHGVVSFPSWRPMACAVGRHGCFLSVSAGMRGIGRMRPRRRP